MASKRIDFISFQEFQKLYKAEKNPEMRVILLLGFGSGLRLSEIVGLEKEISNCCKAYLTEKKVEENGRKLKKKYCNKCEREIKISDIRRKKGEWAIAPLTKDKVDLAKHQIRVDEAKGGKWRVTITPPSLREAHLKLLPITLSRRTVQNRFKKLTMRVLNKNMSPHVLRHGFGNYQMNDLKLSPAMVQQLMGHSRLDTTGIYAKANPEQTIMEAWKKMGGEE